VEELIRGDPLREFGKTLRVGSIAYVVQRCANSHGRFLELSEYGYRREAYRGFLFFFFFFGGRALTIFDSLRRHGLN
jgi:hypothetical protein